MLTTIKLYACNAVKNKFNKFSKRGARPKCRSCRLCEIRKKNYFLFSMHDLWLAKGTLKNHN